MAYKTVFRRYELKYILTLSQLDELKLLMKEYMCHDEYGQTVIRNIYFDTDDYTLIRRSVEKPVYKEKLRVRSYSKASGDSTVFVELKKKYDHVVYKRRISLKEEDAMKWLCGHSPPPEKTQITDEIDYFMSYYKGVSPKAFISCLREAYFDREDDSFRVTFDSDIRYRGTRLSLCEEADGERILPPENVLMEIKCSGGIPLWMTEFLSAHKIYKTSYSKYGTAYKRIVFPSLHNKEAHYG